MINQRTTPTFYRILTVIVLAGLALGGLSPATASATNSVIAFGGNYAGATDIPAGPTDVTAIAAGGMHSLALKSDGTVVGWGNNTSGQVTIPADLTGVVAISGGSDHSLALKGDGTVVAWGNNFSGQAVVPAGLAGVVAIAAGGYHSLALKSDGTVVAWGANWYGQTNVPAGLTGVVAIAAGLFHSLALKSDGAVVGWGDFHFGAANVPAGLTGVIAISAGNMHSLALKSDGTIVGWGTNGCGELSIPSGLTGVVAVVAAGYRSLALKSDGTVVGWGNNLSGQSDIPPGLIAVAIAAGPGHALALGSITNTAPTANPGGPYLGAVNTSIALDGSLSSDPENNPLTYSWTFGDGATGSGDVATGSEAMPAHSYTAAGVYEVCLTVSDGALNSDPACTMAVVYDPSAGFVTGGGSINSPAGAYLADASLTGKARFGFVSKYQKGASVPSGTTAFEFDAAGLAFSSQSYDWLVVNQGGTDAQFKGSGLVNGAADPNGNAYKFMLWAGDGASANSADTFRIKIWWEDANGENLVYDNVVDQAISAGNIVVHHSK